MKHTSNVLEPSIKFQTFAKLVDAEDIANDIRRTYDLTLEVTSITNEQQSQNLETQQSEHLLFTQPRDPNNKHKSSYKKFFSYCHKTNHSVSACFKKQRDDEDKKDVHARSKSPQKAFVQHSRSFLVKITLTEQITNLQTSYDRYRSRSTTRHSKTNCNTSSQNRCRSHSGDRYRYYRTTTPPQYNISRYDNYRQGSRSHRSPYRSSYESPYRRDSRPRYKSRSYSTDIPFPQNTSSNRPPSQPRESRLFRSRSISETKNKINTLQTEQSNSSINFEIHIYHPPEKANALKHTSRFYSRNLHTSERCNDNDYPSRLEISYLLDSGASLSLLN